MCFCVASWAPALLGRTRYAENFTTGHDQTVCRSLQAAAMPYQTVWSTLTHPGFWVVDLGFRAWDHRTSGRFANHLETICSPKNCLPVVVHGPCILPVEPPGICDASSLNWPCNACFSRALASVRRFHTGPVCHALLQEMAGRTLALLEASFWSEGPGRGGELLASEECRVSVFLCRAKTSPR